MKSVFGACVWVETTCVEPTCVEPTCVEPTCVEPTCVEPTCVEPTCVEPTYEAYVEIYNGAPEWSLHVELFVSLHGWIISTAVLQSFIHYWTTARAHIKVICPPHPHLIVPPRESDMNV